MDQNLLALIAKLLGLAEASPTTAPERPVQDPMMMRAGMPVMMSDELNATRDTAGSGMGGLAQMIGRLMGGGSPNGTRAPIPYQQGSGQSAERAIYGEGGGDYGSSPGQMTAGLAPGQRVFDTDRNAWGLKQ